MATMSRAMVEKRHARLSTKRKLTRREEVVLLACGAVLHNGGAITTQRDHTARTWFAADKLNRDLALSLLLIVVFGFWLVTTPNLQPFLYWAFVVLVVWGIAGVLPFPVAAFMRWRDIHRPGWLMSEIDRDVEKARSEAVWEAEHGMPWHESMRADWPEPPVCARRALYQWPSLLAWATRQRGER
jgi:hypothetical protein